MRMVDADALIKAMGVRNYMRPEWTPTAAWGVPIVEAEPVRHGHWIEHELGLICSECNHYTEAMYDEPFNYEFGTGWAFKRPYYCGYCGAKMDSEDPE